MKLNGNSVSVIDLINSNPIRESAGIWFSTDSERVLVGRTHRGDENGYTTYTSGKLSILTSNLPEAPEGTIIIPDQRLLSDNYQESNSFFLCPSNTVMTGRYHTGDENGTTRYQYSTLKAIGPDCNEVEGIITIEDVSWHSVTEDSGLGFDAPLGYVIVGRMHYGDEGASTRYAVGRVKFNGHPTNIIDYCVSEPVIESSGSLIESGVNQVITARHHYDDENGYTYYGFGTISCDAIPSNQLPFDLVVAMHPNDQYKPMSPTDFITLSRLRKHVPNHTDYGYNKITGSFILGNQYSQEYFNAPLSVVNSFYSNVYNQRLYNYRPYDDMTLESYGYFLESFDNLKGDTKPNGRVPVFIHTNEYNSIEGYAYTMIDFWMFFGYNYSKKGIIDFSHQGDWEHVLVILANNQIQGAFLSQHTDLKYVSAQNLDISVVNGRTQLKIYCAHGSHALYKDVGNHPIAGGWNDDVTADEGLSWKITDCVEVLDEQPWKLYSGAWGNVGLHVGPIERSDTTGPLGPWYKRFDFWYEENLSQQEVIPEGVLAVVPNEYFLSEVQPESTGFYFEAPQNMVLVGRKHIGNGNGLTVCLYASLTVINRDNLPVVSGPVTVVDSFWDTPIPETNSEYMAPAGYVIIGRRHVGNSNGTTQYKVGRLSCNNRIIHVTPDYNLIPNQEYMESKGVFFKTSPFFLYVGRTHFGDQDGITTNIQGLATFIP